MSKKTKENPIEIVREVTITDDYIFKNIFAEEDLLIDFLSSVLIEPGKILPKDTKLLELEFIKNEELQKLHPDLAKKVYFDLKVTTTHGLFIIEVQKEGSYDYLKRGEFYCSTTHSSQRIKGSHPTDPMKDYRKALPVILISIVGDKIFSDRVPCINYHITLETETLEHLTGPISYVYIELGKFDNPKYIQKNITEKAREWLHLFKESAIDDEYKNPLVNKAINYVKYIINNKYDQYVLSQIAEQAIINEKEEAIEKGVQRGMQQGKIEIAKKMLLDKFDIESISKYSGLNAQEIAALKRK